MKVRLILTGGTYAEMPTVTDAELEPILAWFHTAEDNQVLSINFPEQKKAAHYQKRHIVLIEVDQ